MLLKKSEHCIGRSVHAGLDIARTISLAKCKQTAVVSSHDNRRVQEDKTITHIFSNWTPKKT